MQVCDKARDMIKNRNRIQFEKLQKFLELCESPVEQILLVALFDRWGGEVNLELKRLQCHFGADFPTYDGVFTACCEPQRNIIVPYEGKYRVDFYIFLTRFGTVGAVPDNLFSPELVKLIVEVDGHEFHEKTKWQASRDRERDRNLLLEGYYVTRFTGSDVFNDPEGCSEKIDDILNKFAHNIFYDYLHQGRLAELICGINI